MKKHKGKTANIPMALLWGGITGMGITLAGTAVLTFLIAGEKLGLQASQSAQVVVLLLASIIGAWIAVKMAGQKPLVVGALSGGIYYLCMLCTTALFFDGQYQGMGVTALVVLGGSMAAALISLRSWAGKRKKRYRAR